MKRLSKLKSDVLRSAALQIAEQSGRPLRRDPSQARRHAYLDPTERLVLLRTSNDRVLTVRASSTIPREADLDIDGCDILFISMPTEKRGTAEIEAYWIPSEVAASALKRAHQTWLDGNPSTMHDNKTYSIWFDEVTGESGMFREKWSAYRLPATVRLEGGATVPQ